MTIPEMIAVLQAADRREPLQHQWTALDESSSWEDGPPPEWDFKTWRVRVKPKWVEGFVAVWPDGSHSDFLYASEASAKASAQGRTDRPVRIAHMREVKE